MVDFRVLAGRCGFEASGRRLVIGRYTIRKGA
jgi:hypothetical protein